MIDISIIFHTDTSVVFCKSFSYAYHSIISIKCLNSYFLVLFPEFFILFFLFFSEFTIDIVSCFMFFVVFYVPVSQVTNVYFYTCSVIVIDSSIFSAGESTISHSESE